MRNADTKGSRARAAIFSVLIAAPLLGLLGACTGQETPNESTSTVTSPAKGPTPVAARGEPGTEKTPAVENTGDAEHEAPPAPDLTPAQPDEVRQALARVYEKTLRIDEASAGRALVGDFNGDGWADIAVVVRPSPFMLKELNSEVANWIVEDPHAVFDPNTATVVHRFPQQEERARIVAGDTLLAIIHGHEAAGWRNPEAKQSYLLRNAVGDGMKFQPLREAKYALPAGKKRPRLQGDVISETLGAEAGILYWTGAKYGWHH